MKQAMILAIAVSFAVEAGAVEDVIKLKRGVEFPHKFHQDTLKECTKCHEKQPPGKIEGFGKEWAHKNCRGCHTARNPRTACLNCHKL